MTSPFENIQTKNIQTKTNRRYAKPTEHVQDPIHHRARAPRSQPLRPRRGIPLASRSFRRRNVHRTFLPRTRVREQAPRHSPAQDSVDKKIVLFNKSSKGNHAASKNRKASNIFRFNIAAAAAVAILGSVAALMLPNNTPAETSTAAATTETENIAPTAFVPNQLPQTNFVPTSYDRNLSNTRDQSVIWKDNNQPYRVLLHTFTDRISKDNENGETIQVEQPSFEYSLIPEKVD